MNHKELILSIESKGKNRGALRLKEKEMNVETELAYVEFACGRTPVGSVEISEHGELAKLKRALQEIVNQLP